MQKSVDRPSRRYTVLIFLSSGYIAARINIQGFIAMMPLVQREFGITGAQAGMYASFYFLSATVVAVSTGRIVDRLGSGRGIAIAAGAVGGMMLLHAASPAYGVLLLLSFFTGIAFSLITPSVSKGVMENVAPALRAGSMGIAHGIGGSGALIGAALMPAFGAIYGWRAVLSVGGLFALAISVIVLRYYRRVAVPETHIAREAAESGDMKKLFRNRPLMTVCILGTVLGMSISSVTSHLALFLTQDLGYTPAVAGIALGAVHVGGMAGQPTWGVVNDRVFAGNRRLGLISLSLGVSTLSLVFGLVVAANVLPVVGTLGVSFLMGFLAIGMQSIYFTSVSEIVPHRLTGAATGVALIFTRAGVVVAAPVFGLLADLSGNYSLSWIVLSAAVCATTVLVIALSRK